jgi:hypothetical protein
MVNEIVPYQMSKALEEEYLAGHSFGDHGLTQLIRATSWATDIPEAFCAMNVAHTISSGIGKGVLVSFKEGESTSLGLFLFTIMRSGMGKTKAAKSLQGCLEKLHHDKIEQWKTQAKPKLEVKKKALERKLAKLEKEYEKSESEETLDRMVEAQAETEKITGGLDSPKIYADDVTVEWLSSMLPSMGGADDSMFV